MDGIVGLNAALNTLDNPKYARQNQNKNGNPERKPLDTLPSVNPPLAQRTWLRIVKSLL